MFWALDVYRRFSVVREELVGHQMLKDLGTSNFLAGDLEEKTLDDSEFLEMVLFSESNTLEIGSVYAEIAYFILLGKSTC